MGKDKRRRYLNFLKSWSFVFFSLTNKPAIEIKKKEKNSIKKQTKRKKRNKNLPRLLPTFWSFHRQTTSSRTSPPPSPSTTAAAAVSTASATLETRPQGNDSHRPEYDPDLNPNRSGFLICLLFIGPCCFFLISGAVKVVLK